MAGPVRKRRDEIHPPNIDGLGVEELGRRLETAVAAAETETCPIHRACPSCPSLLYCGTYCE